MLIGKSVTAVTLVTVVTHSLYLLQVLQALQGFYKINSYISVDYIMIGVGFSTSVIARNEAIACYTGLLTWRIPPPCDCHAIARNDIKNKAFFL